MKTKPNTATADTIPSLKAILDMKAAERVSLYQRCDSELRSRFLIQGKVLHTLDDGEEVLKKAGIAPSSLNNARFAAAAMSLADPHRPKPVMIRVPGEKKAVPLTEAIFDTFTLEQCRLLCFGSTNRGDRAVAHKPSPEKFYEILEKHEDWAGELECVFEHGATRADLRKQEREAKKLIDEQNRLAAEAAALQAAAAPPDVPVVGAAPSLNVVPFPVPTAPATSAATPPPTGNPDCTACEGTGLNSKGGPCHPCSVTGDHVGDTSPVETGETSRDPLTLTFQDWNEEFDVFAGQTRAMAATLSADERAHVIGRLQNLTSQLENASSAAPKKTDKPKSKVGKVKPPKASAKAA